MSLKWNAIFICDVFNLQVDFTKISSALCIIPYPNTDMFYCAYPHIWIVEASNIFTGCLGSITLMLKGLFLLFFSFSFVSYSLHYDVQTCDP